MLTQLFAFRDDRPRPRAARAGDWCADLVLRGAPAAYRAVVRWPAGLPHFELAPAIPAPTLSRPVSQPSAKAPNSYTLRARWAHLPVLLVKARFGGSGTRPIWSARSTESAVSGSASWGA